MNLRSSDWHRTATRWTQLTLTENDPVEFDPAFWIDVMRRSRSNATCLSAGGYMAFYPTRIPYHYRSRHLGDGDPFGALVDGARGLGMHVMARVDSHAVHADALAAHPEWVALTPDGAPREHWAFPGTYVTCPFGPYNREFITEVARELVRDYDIDAVFANRWQGHGVSYSEHARRAFFDATGHELPVEPYDPDDVAWKAYVPWRRQQLSELVALWDTAVKDVRPHARFIPNLGSLAVHELDRDLIERHYPFFVLDRQGREGIEAPWAAGRNAKRSRGAFRDRPVGLISSVGPEHPGHRWKDSVASPAEIRMWIADGVAQGAFPWFTKFNGTVPDDRWVAPVVEAFGQHATVEPVLSRMRVTADVALFDAAEPGDDAHDDGFYQALVEAGIPFEFVSGARFTAEELGRFRVLVLANAERMSDEACAVIEEFVRAGGGVVAGYRTSLCGEDGTPRADFGLADVLGVHLEQDARGPVKNNYIALTGEHPLSAGYPGARRIIGGTQLLRVAAAPDADVPFRFVPDYPDLPMEELYARRPPEDPAVVARHRPGQGRTVHLAFDVGALFWEALQSDHGQLIAAAVTWALGEPPRVGISGPGLHDVAVHEGDGELAVCVVNLTNPMTMRGPVRELVPVGPLAISVALPPGCTGATARLLVAGAEPDVTVTNGRASVVLDSVELLEVLHLRWDGRP
ncbi:alpha-amylase family protein [Pseudonocardia sp. MH-G8]|uniref:alpha-amylase family protein n=1 Tax=Pseudonocardia sp. MH-G8 TaxID=1854588 RepID=UPI000BA0ADE1|nr:alpha-amylase family protein [Pseudonocardia sp. MH-G8]OZM82100.1 hypothetical protein CFP66_09810 [Pseudonocardia sp. MH-G8]